MTARSEQSARSGSADYVRSRFLPPFGKQLGDYRRGAPAGWERTQVVRSEAGHICLIGSGGVLVASSDNLVQLTDVLRLGVGASPDGGAPITCALVNSPASVTKRRCNCKGLTSTTKLPPFLEPG